MSKSSLWAFLRVISSLIFICALLVTGLNVFAASTSDPVSMQLFPDSDVPGSLDTASDPTIIRTRFVDVNFGILDGTEVGDALLFDLFEDVVFTGVLDRLEATNSGGYSWIGHLKGVDHSQVVLVVDGGQVAGNITLPGAFYQVRFAGNGVHGIYKIDQSVFLPEADPASVELSDEAIAEAEAKSMLDDGSVIDVMVVYTADARAAAGGTVAMQNIISLAVTETNQSYLNSGIAQQINLVHTEEVTYTETGDISLALSRLQNPADGYMDNVHTLRDTHMADLVDLIVEDGGPYCGIGYFMSTVSTAFEEYGFTVVARNCATGYYSFGHELGHNMGAHHDWYVYDGVLPYTYSHAYLNIPDQWRTIMAYNNECADNGVYCTRLQYWSNPDVIYGGDPMGVPAGTSTACVTGDLGHPDCDADQRLTLNNTAFTVANFRESSVNVGPMVYDSHLIDDDNFDNSAGNDDGIVDCGETIELYVDLLNQGADPATGVVATISSSDPYISFLYNTSSGYPDIPGGSTGTNTDDFDFAVDPATPNGHMISFGLDITASNGGPWSDTFNVPVTCGVPEIEVAPPAFSVTLGVDETHVETLAISNLGLAPLEFSIIDVETGAPVVPFDGPPSDFTDDMNAFPRVNNDPPTIVGDPGPVLIIQDSLPWGYDSIQSILTSNGIAYDQVNSSQIPTVDLSPYDMIIIPSVQGDTFYTTWNANIGRFEAYVNSGGKLWQSTCNFSSTVTEPLVPGGVVSTSDGDYYNVIVDPTHPWVVGVPDPMYGSWASHDSFSNLYPGSIVVAAAQTSGNPTLVDYQYGAGRILITGQTLEFAWGNAWDGAPILENSLLDMYTSGPAADVLIIQDNLPWGYDAIQSTLSAHGIAYDEVDSSQIPTVDLSPYEMVVIPSVQGDSFYTIWNANIGRFEAYVNAGGKLWQSTCNHSSTVTEPLGPGGVVSATDLDNYNDIVEPAHPWVAGVPNPMYGTYASHDSFTNLYPGSIVVAAAQTSGNPTLVDYRLGAGRILITGQTLEFAWGQGQDGAPIVENSLLDLYGTSPSPDALWLSESPSMGTVGPGETVYVDVEFDTTGLTLGAYTADIVISNNDPDEDPVIVPVTMVVEEGVADLWIEPPSAVVPISGETTVDIMVDDVTDLYGIELELAFDPTIVEVVGAQVAPGSCPVPDFVVENIADNVLGTINYAASSLSPSPPCTPGGVVASITFRGLAQGLSPVEFTSWLLADVDGFPIGVETVTPGEVYVEDIATLEGYVELQGRTDHGGAEVCAWVAGNPFSCETTDPSGYYLMQVPQDTYDIVVEMELYLDGLKTGVFVPAGGVVTLPSVVLLGGDANEDETVNILDLAFIGGRFGFSEGDPGWDPRADINNDLTVNILDIVLAASNYLKSSPVPWP